MIYRVLQVEEWEPLVGHEFIARLCPLPDPRFAMIVAAFDEEHPETLEGFIVCQLQFHLEPLVIYNPHCLGGLISTAENELKRRVGACTYYAFAEGKVAKIAELLGLEKVTMEIWKKKLE
jgi:hypothetical protein